MHSPDRRLFIGLGQPKQNQTRDNHIMIKSKIIRSLPSPIVVFLQRSDQLADRRRLSPRRRQAISRARRYRLSPPLRHGRQSGWQQLRDFFTIKKNLSRPAPDVDVPGVCLLCPTCRPNAHNPACATVLVSAALEGTHRRGLRWPGSLYVDVCAPLLLVLVCGVCAGSIAEINQSTAPLAL